MIKDQREIFYEQHYDSFINHLETDMKNAENGFFMRNFVRV